MLDNEPRWLRGRGLDDMMRKLTELRNSATRARAHSTNSNFAATARPGPPLRARSISDVGGSIHTSAIIPSAMAPFTTTSTATNNAPSAGAGIFHGLGLIHNSLTGFANDNAADILNPSRQSTVMSTSTTRTTGSYQQLLPGYTAKYVSCVKKLLKNYTWNVAALPNDDFVPYPPWLNDRDSPSPYEDRPFPLPADFLALDLDTTPDPAHFTSWQHASGQCLCKIASEPFHSPWTNFSGLTDDRSMVFDNSLALIDGSLCDPFGNTIFHFLAARNLHMLEFALHRFQSDVSLLNHANSAGQTFLHALNLAFLHNLAINPDTLDRFLTCLLEIGVDVYAKDHYGRTVFHQLLLQDRLGVELYSVIDRFDASLLSKRDAFGVTPATLPDLDDGDVPMTPRRRSIDTIQTLNIPQQVAPVLENREVRREARLLEALRLAEENPNHEDFEGHNGLHCLALVTLSVQSLMLKFGLNPEARRTRRPKKKAAEGEGLDSSEERLKYRLTILSSLLEDGIDPNHYDNGGNTPLMMFAAELPEDDDYKLPPLILETLIEGGANVHARNRAGETALSIAVRCGNKLAVRTLINKGANVHVHDANGRSLLDILDVKVVGLKGTDSREYAHLEACRAHLSSDKIRAVQCPSTMSEWLEQRPQS